MAASYRTGCGTRSEEAVHAGSAHGVIAFGVYEEGERWVEVAGRFANRAYLVLRVVEDAELARRSHDGMMV